MQAVFEFIKTTLLGGVLVIAPMYLTGLLLLKALAGLVALISPLTAGLPDTTRFPTLVAILLLIAICFAGGIAVRTRPGLWAKNLIERAVLQKIPGYVLIRSLAGRLAGRDEEQAFTVVLAEIEEALVPAFLVEDCGDGQCVVFVPSVPTPAAGAIYIMSWERVHRVDVPLMKAVNVISKWGAGSSELLAGMKRVKEASRVVGT